MKSLVASLALAAVLVAAGAGLWALGRTEQALAVLHADFMTLQFRSAVDRAGDFESGLAAIAVPGGGEAAQSVARADRAAAEYWLGSYGQLTDARGVQGSGSAADAEQQLLASNAAYRVAEREAVDRTTALTHLESVVKSYAEVLKARPDSADAAYNYEFVVRARNALAKSGAAAPKTDAAAPAAPATIHGRLGAPPKGTSLAGFRVLVPQRSDERDNGPEAGKGGPKQRKG